VTHDHVQTECSCGAVIVPGHLGQHREIKVVMGGCDRCRGKTDTPPASDLDELEATLRTLETALNKLLVTIDQQREVQTRLTAERDEAINLLRPALDWLPARSPVTGAVRAFLDRQADKAPS
jgi:hypothetical protein